MNTPRREKRTASERSPLEGETSKKIKEEILSPLSNMAEGGDPGELVIDLSEAPSWFKLAFDVLTKRLDGIDSKCGEALSCGSLAADTAAAALAQTNDLSTRMKKLEIENTHLRHQMGLMEDKHQMVLDKLSALESHSRHNNLIFEGVPESPDEDEVESERLVKNIFKDNLKVEQVIKLDTVHRIGPKTEDKPRPIIAKFSTPKDRKSVWKKRSNLKHSNYVMQENYSRRVENIRKLYYPIVKRANSLETYKNKVFIKFDKLVYNKREYSQEELDQLPEELQPNNVYTKCEGDVYAFYGRGAKLSNFHPCRFTDDGINFTCVEQHYCYHKAKYAGNNRLARKVLLADHPADMKKLTNKIPGFNEQDWKEHSIPLMSRALSLKFKSSQVLAKTLLDTGEKTLVEANPHDKYYGAGRAMQDDELFQDPTAVGENKLGVLLMELRAQMRGQQQGPPAS